MQTRGRFLKSVGGAALFGWLGGRVTPAPAEIGIVRDSVLTPVADYELYTSGGLCTPLTPFYDLPTIERYHALADAIPRFSAMRGGVEFDRLGA